jgi:copper(I)-binding protein
VAHEIVAGDLRIQHPWVRAVPRDAVWTTGYIIGIVNDGPESDQLLGATLDAGGTAVVRASQDVNGVKTLEVLPQGIDIPPKSEVGIRPGEMHLYFEGLKRSLRAGEVVAGSLLFRRAGKLAIEFVVEPEELTTEEPIFSNGTAASATAPR